MSELNMKKKTSLLLLKINRISISWGKVYIKVLKWLIEHQTDKFGYLSHLTERFWFVSCCNSIWDPVLIMECLVNFFTANQQWSGCRIVTTWYLHPIWGQRYGNLWTKAWCTYLLIVELLFYYYKSLYLTDIDSYFFILLF